MNLWVALASALVLTPVSAVAQEAAKISAAKEAWQDCMFSHAQQMYHGKDTMELERQVIESCRSEFEEWMSAQGNIGRSTYESLVPMTAQAAIQNAAEGGGR